LLLKKIVNIKQLHIQQNTLSSAKRMINAETGTSPSATDFLSVA